MTINRVVRFCSMVLAIGFLGFGFAKGQAPQAGSANAPSPMMDQHDGSHDFDFLIGNWKAHVRRLPDRLTGSKSWIEYDGTSNHKKLLDSNANFEEFEVDNPEKHLHIKAQTLRLYNPESHQWSIYLLDLDKGVLSVPPVVGQFKGNRESSLIRKTIRDGRSWFAMSG